MPGHELGHRMLDLEARVQLHEVEAALWAEEELEGAGVPVPRCRHARSTAASISSRSARRDRRRGRFLDQLLVTALDRALALAERENAALPVREDLHLDVTAGTSAFST